jgi:hypothetical protein
VPSNVELINGSSWTRPWRKLIGFEEVRALGPFSLDDERRRDFGQGGKAYSRGPRLVATHEERRHRQLVSVCAAVGVELVAQSGADSRGLLC